MSHIWTFSPTSKLLLEKCIKAAPTPLSHSNIWLQRFGQKVLSSNGKEQSDEASDVIVIEDSEEVEIPQENQEDSLKTIEEFTDPDLDLLYKFDKLLERSSCNPKLLKHLALNCPENTINVLINHVIDSEDIDKQFLKQFYEYFLPAFIKKYNSRQCIDLMKKIHRLHPHFFKILIKEIMKDLEIQNNIVHDFILTLNVDQQTEFLNDIASFKLSSEEFSLNLHNIFTAYKYCNKSDTIQNNILTFLKDHSQFCATDKNYGKLFLAYLQTEKELKSTIDIICIQNILGIHQSPFKRPCVAILNELNNC